MANISVYSRVSAATTSALAFRLVAEVDLEAGMFFFKRSLRSFHHKNETKENGLLAVLFQKIKPPEHNSLLQFGQPNSLSVLRRKQILLTAKFFVLACVLL